VIRSTDREDREPDRYSTTGRFADTYVWTSAPIRTGLRANPSTLTEHHPTWRPMSQDTINNHAAFVWSVAGLTSWVETSDLGPHVQAVGETTEASPDRA
jgi:hypothetical protein